MHDNMKQNNPPKYHRSSVLTIQYTQEIVIKTFAFQESNRRESLAKQYGVDNKSGIYKYMTTNGNRKFVLQSCDSMHN